MTTEPNDPKIEQLLDQLRQVPPRDRQAAIRGRGRFLAQAASLRNTQPIRTPKNRLAMLFSPSWLYRKQKFAMFVTFILVLAVLFSGTGLTAYAAQESLPGEVLYPVKTAVEDVRLGLTTDPAAEYALLDQYLTTRFEELDALNAAGEPLNSAFANRLLLQLDQMLRIAASQSDADMIENLDHLYIRLMDQDRLSWYDDDQEGEVYGVGLQLREEIVTRARLITQGTEDPVEFRLELQNRTQTNIPVERPPTPLSASLAATVLVIQARTPINTASTAAALALALTPPPVPALAPASLAPLNLTITSLDRAVWAPAKKGSHRLASHSLRDVYCAAGVQWLNIPNPE